MRSVVSERGQVTIPKLLRDRLGIGYGQVLEFTVEGGRLVATKTMDRDHVDSVYGVLGTPTSTDEVLTDLRGAPDTT